MAAVVMVSNPNPSQEQHDQPQILINNNNNNNSMLNNNLINQQQLQLLAAAAAAVGSGSCLCSNGGGVTGGACVHNLCHQSSKNNNHAVDHCLSQPPLVNLGMSPHVTEYKMNDFKSLEQLETLCRQMTEQAMN